MDRPPLYKTVDTLFHGVMDRKWVPKYFKDRPGLSAAVLGTTGTVVGLGALDFATEKILPKFHEYNFDLLEGLAIAGLTGALIQYSDKIGNWAKEHPVYTPGMAFTIASAYGYAIADLLMK